jgi:hypothetical protein
MEPYLVFTWPSTAQPSWTVPVIFHLCQKAEACARGAHARVRPPPACLPLPLDALASLDVATRRPAPLSLSLSFSLLPWIPLSRPARALSSPPLAARVATVHPSPHRRAQKLRHFVLDPLAELHNAGRLEAPPPMPSSSSGRRDRLRRPARFGPPPSSPWPLLQPL